MNPKLATSPLFATHEARKENAAELHAILLSQFNRNRCAIGARNFAFTISSGHRFLTLDEAVRDPQMRHCGAITNFEYPGHGVIETVSSPIFVADSEKTEATYATRLRRAYTRGPQGGGL